MFFFCEYRNWGLGDRVLLGVFGCFLELICGFFKGIFGCEIFISF